MELYTLHVGANNREQQKRERILYHIMLLWHWDTIDKLQAKDNLTTFLKLRPCKNN